MDKINEKKNDRAKRRRERQAVQMQDWLLLRWCEAAATYQARKQHKQQGRYKNLPPYKQKQIREFGKLSEEPEKKPQKPLTRKQTQAVILCSGSFGKMTAVQAAEEMGISKRAVYELLSRAKKIRPQIFPLLTIQQATMLDSLDLGKSYAEISELLGVSAWRIYDLLNELHDSGHGIAKGGRVKIEQYREEMDDRIVRRF